MLERKQENKTKIIPNLQKKIAEICVKNERESEPFIKVFQYNEENIAKSSLGSLIGIFEITERNEDTTYIVNFLASVARKEYFSNGRRGSLESLEASLHKINLALAELVKNGNVSWLGNLHGTIGVLEKNNFHFSVTGNAKIFLFRNKSLSEISEGIASSESSLHPIKTFIEISSGRLIENDKILLTSPELCDLLTNEALETNAKRMDNTHFFQFLETVLINQVETGGALVVDLSAPLPVSEKTKKIRNNPKDITNVFSQDTFKKQDSQSNTEIPKQDEDISQKNISEEYTDKKTGHIFVQGETYDQPTENMIFEKMKDFFHDRWYTLRVFFVTECRSFSKGKRKTIVLLNILSEKILFSTKKLFFPSLKHLKQTIQKNPSTSFFSSSNASQKEFTREKESLNITKKISVLVFWLSRNISFLVSSLRTFFTSLSQKLHNDKKKRTIIIGITTFFLLIISLFFFFSRTKDNSIITTPVDTNPPLSPSFPIEKEKNSSILSSPFTTVITLPDTPPITSFLLNKEIYVATESSLIHIDDKKKYDLPNESGRIQLVTVMDDLGVVFLYTDKKILLSFSPTNHTFTKNILLLSPEIQVSGMSTYLTYLYIFDQSSKQIYRFPRADGGFGEGTLWLKENIPFALMPSIAVSENIFLARENDIALFLRGRFIKNLESPTLPFTPTALFTKSNFHSLYALDKENSRIVIFDQSGALIAQYFSEQFALATSIVVDEEKRIIFLTTTENTLISFPLPLEQ